MFSKHIYIYTQLYIHNTLYITPYYTTHIQPSRERLNAWYTDILARAYKLNIVSKVTNIYAEYFAAYARRDKEDGFMQRQAAKRSYIGI